MKSLISKLIRAGLSTAEAELYVFIYNNPYHSVADACLHLKQSKSSIYRAFDELKNKNLIRSSHQSWKQSLTVNSLNTLIQQLKNQNRRDRYLINYFKSLEIGKQFHVGEKDVYIEELDEQETYEKYIDLSEMKWDSLIAFVNWEDFNNENRNLIPLEKQFVKNRLKHGSSAFVSIAKYGPYTQEITDCDKLDVTQNRKSKRSKLPMYKPFLVNAFQGNDYVHIWDLNKTGEIISTFIHSPVIANFYKDLIYSNIV
ncbi:MarR family transcriptional regulator [Candidatus Peregrinibacteria bacterium]|nr:MarR family transcriptional regulator [Candidatus Peregrinibacteria bacterium]